MKKLLVILCFFFLVDANAQHVIIPHSSLEAFLGASYFKTTHYSGPPQSGWGFAFNTRYNFEKNRKMSKHVGLHFYSLNTKEQYLNGPEIMRADYASVDARVGLWPGKKVAFLIGVYYAYAYNYDFEGIFWPKDAASDYQRHDFGFNFEIRIHPKPYDGVILTLGLNAGIIPYFTNYYGLSSSNKNPITRNALFISAGYPIFKRPKKN